MFRSSVTAFYSLAKCLFYRRAFHRDTFNILFFLRLHVLSKGKKIIYRMSEILLAAEISFAVQKSKTHFEQIPVEIVKKIAKEHASDDGKDRADTTIGTSKLKPHRLPSLGKNGKRV